MMLQYTSHVDKTMLEYVDSSQHGTELVKILMRNWNDYARADIISYIFFSDNMLHHTDIILFDIRMYYRRKTAFLLWFAVNSLKTESYISFTLCHIHLLFPQIASQPMHPVSQNFIWRQWNREKQLAYVPENISPYCTSPPVLGPNGEGVYQGEGMVCVQQLLVTDCGSLYGKRK